MNAIAKLALQEGKYIIDTQLGQGIFNLTYRATHSESGQTVIIKTLGQSLHQHPEFDRFKQQFLEVAERLSRCQHPNLVRILDWFEDSGCPYLVMEYVPGQTLAEIIAVERVLEPQALEYIRQIGAALIVLHEAGLLHRDVKPENIIRRQDSDSVVLCEFGITCDFTPGVMQTHANLLGAGYIPLEQYDLQGERTKSTDLYALAATLYCLLTGRPPLPAPVRKALYLKGGNRLFSPDLYQGKPKISTAVKQALWYGLELAHQRRPQTIEAWFSQLLSQEPPKVPEVATIQLDPAMVPQTTKKENLDSPLPSPAQSSVKKPTTQNPTRDQTKVSKIKTQPAIARKGQKSKPKTARARSPLQALLMTGAIAASAGMGFGLAVRLNHPAQPGSTLLHTQQTFPPRSDWPVSESHL
ncbi:MAG TPA: hypothetical protein DDZ80_18565 [Cyanobacteria bacterium UBA8803]|nr:hypothetical protein [Cyanobacteria bacterium UBA8803]